MALPQYSLEVYTQESQLQCPREGGANYGHPQGGP